MYWAKIKGRFKGSLKDGASKAQRRIHLAMKYGSIWRAKVQVRKWERQQPPTSQVNPGSAPFQLEVNSQISAEG
eukprot:CAMPEP_0170500878 /NCGR_PEP_ID=MMETSP0208-20121228/36399_1 /TAXON_ID=197538 /ORGANISM="Strombidium inclinatum, Strain S3" /LENGTH=73 /DNA_ID=CAMNT_0010779125 /DNA_START=79 /DNA_END=296 /DNA_ORIENTATION=-